MHGDLLIILFFLYSAGVFAQKLLKKKFSHFLFIVLIAGSLLHMIIHNLSFDWICLLPGEKLLLLILALAGFYLLFFIIIPWLGKMRGNSDDYSPQYKAYKQEESDKKRFLEAILHGDMEVVNQMLGVSPERINLKGPGREHLADYALKKGRQSMAEFLRGFEKALKSRKEILKRAIIEGDISKAEEVAGRDGHLVKLPLDASGKTALHFAVERGNTALIAFLIEKGADVNEKDREGAGPLHYAAAIGHLEASRLLIVKGAQVTAFDQGGTQPIHEAAMSGNIEVARILIEHGSNPNSVDKVLRWTPLYYAEYYDRREMVDFLLSKGATLSVKDTFGRAPCSACAESASVSSEVARAQEKKKKVDDLLVAFRAGNAGKIAQMLDDEPFLANETHGGMPVIHHAVHTRNAALIRILLERGAQVDGKDDRGYTALCSVIFGGFEKSSHNEITAIVRLLLDYRADPNIAVDASGFSPLHFAVQNDNRSAAEILIEHGADINSNLREWGTPLHWAECSGTPQMVKFLKDRGARK